MYLLTSLSFHMQAQVPRGTKLDLSQNQLVTLPVSVLSSHRVLLASFPDPVLDWDCQNQTLVETCMARNGLVWLFVSSKLLKGSRNVLLKWLVLIQQGLIVTEHSLHAIKSSKIL